MRPTAEGGRLGLLLAVGALTLAGCSAVAVGAESSVPTASTSRSAIPSSPGPLIIGDLTSEIVSLGGSGVHLSPPPAGASPAVSGRQAFATYNATFPHPEWNGVPAHVLLATYVSYATGLSVSASPGSSPPPTLVWVVMYNDVPTMTFAGGPYRPSSVPAPSYSLVHCQFGMFIEATTGKYMSAEQGCPDFTTP